MTDTAEQPIDRTSYLLGLAAGHALSVGHLWHMPPEVRNFLLRRDPEMRAAAEKACRTNMTSLGCEYFQVLAWTAAACVCKECEDAALVEERARMFAKGAREESGRFFLWMPEQPVASDGAGCGGTQDQPPP